MAAELKDHFFKEVQSFKSPPPKEVAPLPVVGEPARQHADSVLQLPKDKPTIIVFLRHCGCPCKPGRNLPWFCFFVFLSCVLSFFF